MGKHTFLGTSTRWEDIPNVVCTPFVFGTQRRLNHAGASHPAPLPQTANANYPEHPHRKLRILFSSKPNRAATHASRKPTDKVADTKATRTKSSLKHKKRSVAHVPTLHGDPLIESK